MTNPSDEKRELAMALFKALKRAGPDALVDGYGDSVPLSLDDVTIDGNFDLEKAAAFLLESCIRQEKRDKSAE